MTRRCVLVGAAITTGALIASSGQLASAKRAPQPSGWSMPDEGDPHQRTWMAFGASRDIWGTDLLPEVQRNLTTIATTIALYEPVSMLVRENELALARDLVGSSVDLIVAELDDLWIRDTGPVFVVYNTGEKAGINFNFNGWGEKQEFQQDAGVAPFVTQQSDAVLITSRIVMEGGGIEVDGAGTAILTESCILNDNRNPGLSKTDIEDELAQLLGIKKFIWLPGIKGKDITDGHIDFYARFARPGVVLAGFEPDPAWYDHQVTKTHLEILNSETDALGRPLQVLVLEGPATVREAYDNDDFAAGYVGFYLCDSAVIMQEFGDAQADLAARQVLESAFPERTVLQLNVDGIAAGGGSIHCATQQEPLV